MTFEEALHEIRGFWTDSQFPFGGTGLPSTVSDLERQFDRSFSPTVRDYVTHVIKPKGFVFDRVGNPIELYGSTQLTANLPGYNVDALTNRPLEGWSDEWLLIGDEGADPIIVELREGDREVPVLQSLHGTGTWKFTPIARSLPRFILLAAGFHHAMNLHVPAGEELITDDERGFNLHPAAAEWLVPRVRAWEPDYAQKWLDDFDNARQL